MSFPLSAKTKASPTLTGLAGLSRRLSWHARVSRIRPSSMKPAAKVRVLKKRARQSQMSARHPSWFIDAQLPHDAVGGGVAMALARPSARPEQQRGNWAPESVDVRRRIRGARVFAMRWVGPNV